jgi:hypothetical protein
MNNTNSYLPENGFATLPIQNFLGDLTTSPETADQAYLRQFPAKSMLDSGVKESNLCRLFIPIIRLYLLLRRTVSQGKEKSTFLMFKTICSHLGLGHLGSWRKTRSLANGLYSRHPSHSVNKSMYNIASMSRNPLLEALTGCIRTCFFLIVEKRIFTDHPIISMHCTRSRF